MGGGGYRNSLNSKDLRQNFLTQSKDCGSVLESRRLCRRNVRGFTLVELLVICVVLFSGCGFGKPAGSPKTVPFSVSVTKAGKPLEGATIFFVPDSHSNNLTCVGITDASGNAKMNTDYLTYPLEGAPVGNNKVYLIKEIELEHTKTLEERNKMGYAESMAYFAERERQRAAMPLIVPKVLTSVATSPLTVEVAAGAESLKIEVDDYE